MAALVGMFPRRQAQKSEEGSQSAGGETGRNRSGPPRFLFFFRGRRRSVAVAGSRSKENSALEFWVLLAVAIALIAIVALVCLRAVAAFG